MAQISGVFIFYNINKYNIYIFIMVMKILMIRIVLLLIIDYDNSRHCYL